MTTDSEHGALITPLLDSEPSFINAPRITSADLDTLEADVAILGVQAGVPYDMLGSTFGSLLAPGTMRQQSTRWDWLLSHYDYDFGGDIFAGRDVRVVDCGNTRLEPGTFAENNARSTAAVKAIIERGAVPVILGGGHEITIPVLQAYEGQEPMYLIQIDAHLDWRDEVNGITDGLSSPMRRASEMPWVSGMAQIGIRGVGSARQQEVDDARAYGSLIIGAREVHNDGVDAILARIPDHARYFITFDADGLDPTIAPAVGAPNFGGLSYEQSTRLLQGIANKGQIVGYDFVVIRPALDVRDMTSLIGARLTLNVIGAMAHSGQIGRSR